MTQITLRFSGLYINTRLNNEGGRKSTAMLFDDQCPSLGRDQVLIRETDTEGQTDEYRFNSRLVGDMSRALSMTRALYKPNAEVPQLVVMDAYMAKAMLESDMAENIGRVFAEADLYEVQAREPHMIKNVFEAYSRLFENATVEPVRITTGDPEDTRRIQGTRMERQALPVTQVSSSRGDYDAMAMTLNAEG